MSLGERAWGLAANGAIGVGLAVEYVVILRAIIAGGEAQRESDERVAAAEERAAEANRLAEEERHNRLKLETARAWRSMSAEGQASLIERLKAFPGTRYDMLTVSDDAECASFTFGLTVTLEAAGWQNASTGSFTAFSVEIGVRVEYAAGDFGRLGGAAIAPVRGLTDDGISAVAAAIPGPDTSPDTASKITIRVGRKPERAIH
ncbi:MAG: hypothetical protein ACJ8C3_08365 [Microvirga sp.]